MDGISLFISVFFLLEQAALLLLLLRYTRWIVQLSQTRDEIASDAILNATAAATNSSDAVARIVELMQRNKVTNGTRDTTIK